MLPDSIEGLYAAYKAKDSRFDGRFFIGISSTGIYCRPVCKAKQPKIENCTFYPSAAQAEHAGYRPCLLCRPELAPGTSTADAAVTLARQAARIIEENCGGGQNLEQLARQLGCTARHLRRVFNAQYHVSPVQYLQTCRLLLAKNLLTDTGLSVIDVAMASGFGSLRRFNDLFKSRYHLSPTGLRRSFAEKEGHNGDIVVFLGYRPPYQWENILSFLARRAIPGVDLVTKGKYFRTAQFLTSGGKQVFGWVEVGHKPEKNALSVRVSEALLPALPQVLARIRHLFDLYCTPDAISQTLASMDDIRSGLWVSGTRLPGSFDAFETAVRAVLGQQISVKAASTLAGRIVAAYGLPVQTGIKGLTHIFPSPDIIAALEGPPEQHFGPLGITAARSNTIYKLAQAVSAGHINLGFPARPEEEIEKLRAIPGIGSWTAQYIAMRAMAWPDVFLETDVGVQRALAPYTPKELLKIAEKWRPWRSYATICLWHSLS